MGASHYWFLAPFIKPNRIFTTEGTEFTEKSETQGVESSRVCFTILMDGAVMSERIGERHASACRYKNEIPEGSRPMALDFFYQPVRASGVLI